MVRDIPSCSGEQGFPRGFLSGLGARVSGDDYLECIQADDPDWGWREGSAVLAEFNTLVKNLGLIPNPPRAAHNCL